jgi:hypothetical protein
MTITSIHPRQPVFASAGKLSKRLLRALFMLARRVTLKLFGRRPTEIGVEMNFKIMKSVIFDD